jgi:hypothetical protein
MDVPDTSTSAGCSDWRAWYDYETPDPATLIVTGKCEVPRSNYWVRLRRREQQGDNAKNLLLERIVELGAADGWAVGEHGEPLVTTVTARYKEKTDSQYDTVTILPEDVTVQVADVPLAN